MCVDIPGQAGAVWEPGGVPTFPQVFVDLGDTAGAGLAALSFVGLEGGGGWVSGSNSLLCFSRSRFCDSLIDFHSCRAPYLIRDMSIDVQSCGGGNMADDIRECLDVRAVFQGCGGEGVPQIVEPDVFASRLPVRCSAACGRRWELWVSCHSGVIAISIRSLFRFCNRSAQPVQGLGG